MYWSFLPDASVVVVANLAFAAGLVMVPAISRRQVRGVARETRTRITAGVICLMLMTLNIALAAGIGSGAAWLRWSSLIRPSAFYTSGLAYAVCAWAMLHSDSRSTRS